MDKNFSYSSEQKNISYMSTKRKSIIKFGNFFNDIKKNYELILMALPAVILFVVFNYLPYFGIVIAFQDYNPVKGLFKSKWIGLNNFKFLFTSNDAWRITWNTVTMNLTFIIVGTILAILVALFLNEVKNRVFLKTMQTAYFFPYFTSWVVAGYLFYTFLNDKYGLINGFLEMIGQEPVPWFQQVNAWPGILLSVYLWKNIGYMSIIYYSSVIGIDKEYYEAATVDGANKLQQAMHITMPLLMPIIIIMFILSLGRIFNADFGLFYFIPQDSGVLYPKTDVIDTYVYRALKNLGNFGMSGAVALYQSTVGLILVLLSNYIVKKISKEHALF